jgi:hypothetical protein
MARTPAKPAASRSTAKLTPPATDRLGLNNFEKDVEDNLSKAGVALIRQARTPQGQQFLFRCFIMPAFSVRVFGEAQKKFRTLPYFIQEPWSYVLAHSRMVKEMVHQEALALSDTEPATGEWKCNEDKYALWLQRFDLWRTAIDRAFWYYVTKKGSVTKYEQGRFAWAAELGTIQKQWGLPAAFLGRIVDGMRQRSEKESKIFHLSAAGSPPIRWDCPELDLWLIEIWPLVEGYDWTYLDVWRVANMKFPTAPQKIPPPLQTAEALSNHCKMKGLNLRLSKAAQQRGGRPRGGRTLSQLPPPPLSHLALEIDGFVAPGNTATREQIRLTRLVWGKTG